LPETKAQRAAAKTAATTRKSRVAEAATTRKSRAAEHEGASGVERTTELSEEVLQSVEAGQRAAIEAVRKFLDTVDKALPPRGEGPSRREEITDSALEMAQRLVHTQYDFLRKVVDSAGKALTRSDDAK
jgi:hypothetical protein